MKERYKLEKVQDTLSIKAVDLVKACIANGWKTDRKVEKTALKDLRKDGCRIAKAQVDTLTSELVLSVAKSEEPREIEFPSGKVCKVIKKRKGAIQFEGFALITNKSGNFFVSTSMLPDGRTIYSYSTDSKTEAELGIESFKTSIDFANKIASMFGRLRTNCPVT